MATQMIEFNRPNNSISWGFAIQGGKEFGSPLTILKVTPGSIAHRLGMVMGDIIVSINNERADAFTHSQAITKFKSEKVILELKKPKADNNTLSFPPPPNIDISKFDDSCRISTSIATLPPPPPQLIVNKQPAPRPESPYQQTKPIVKESYPSEIPRPQNVFQDRVSMSIYKYDSPETNKGKNIPQVVLDSKKMELFQKQMEQEKEKDFVSSLGKFIETKNNQPRDSKDQLPQPSNKDSAICCVCHVNVIGHYIEANKKIYCKSHFRCSFCQQAIQGDQFVESKEGRLYCMEDYKNNVAVRCSRCRGPIVEEQIIAMSKCFHPQCFTCDHCKRPIPGGEFHVKEDNGAMLIYCQRDYKDFYELKCCACQFPIDNDDRYLIVAGKNYHDNCYKR